MAKARLSGWQWHDRASCGCGDQSPHEKTGHALVPIQCYCHRRIADGCAQRRLDSTSAVAFPSLMQPWVLVGTVLPGQTYWLRITMLDATLFSTFARCLITKPRELTVRIGTTRFEVSRLLTAPEADSNTPTWIAYSSFAEFHKVRHAQRQYTFEFTTPTAFSMGQKSWGKLLRVFPEPHYVFESLARQWEMFAPAHLRMETSNMTPRSLSAWCEEHVVVSRYALNTSYLPSSKFGQAGFQGEVTYEVKGIPTAPEAQWLTPLAHFALFAGVGYKTTMGMGQPRCIQPVEPTTPRHELRELHV